MTPQAPHQRVAILAEIKVNSQFLVGSQKLVTEDRLGFSFPGDLPAKPLRGEDASFVRLDNPGILTTPYHYSAAWDWRSCFFSSLNAKSLPNGLESAMPKRRMEFAVGRLCVAKAIENLNACMPLAVGINPDGSPCWPQGIVGSITHTGGFVSAAVARSQDCLNLGIDSEKIMDAQTMRSAGEVTVTVEEHLLLKRLPLSRRQFIALIFSAKESIYKCVYPIIKRPFDFSAVTLYDIDCQNRTFRFRFMESSFSSTSSVPVWMSLNLRQNEVLAGFQRQLQCPIFEQLVFFWDTRARGTDFMPRTSVMALPDAARRHGRLLFARFG